MTPESIRHNSQKPPKKFPEAILWAGITKRQSIRKREDEARRSWDHQNMANTLGVPVKRITLQGDIMKFIPLSEMQKTTE